MYSVVLIAHSWVRWLVLAAALVAVARAAGRQRRSWTSADERVGKLLTSALDIQFLLGLLLYFWASPLMATIRAHVADAMRDDAMRYWLLEHPFGMLVAIVLAHVGRVRIRKAVDPARKQRLALIFFGLALVAIAVSLPWPGMATGRPLLRMP